MDEDRTRHDAVDRAREEWARVLPDVDTSAMDVAARLRVVAADLARSAERVVAERGLTRAEFDVLCALRRAGAPLTPTGVAAATLASGAATTKRLDHLTRQGHLERRPDERDGRVSRLVLTPAGTDLVDDLLPRVLEAEHRATAALDPDARSALAGALRALVRSPAT